MKRVTRQVARFAVGVTLNWLNARVSAA